MEIWLAGISSIFSLKPLLVIVVGVAIGIIFGSIPGLTALMAVALCMPLTFGADAVIGLSLLCALYVGGVSGGLIAATLINIPGTPSSVATTFDGYPMTKRGESGRALGIGIFYSFLGGALGFIVLFFGAPLMARIALRFGPFEYFCVAVFALTLVASLSGKYISKGIATAILGIIFAMVGLAPQDSYARFTFGFYDLDGGFGLLAVLTGIFAVSEILQAAEQAKKENQVAIPPFKMEGFFGLRPGEFLAQIPNTLRSATIGVLIGILPGIGGSTSNLVAYSVAKDSSKYPEKFGTGIPDGIIASETSNNASIGGALVTLIALGIPGDGVTAMLLGGFMIHGIQPGPLLIQTNGALIYSVFVALFVANIVMLVLEYYGIRIFAKLLKVPKYYLFPVIIVMCIVGAYGMNSRLFDVGSLLFFGTLGYIMIKLGYPIVPFILGFVMGPIMENKLRTALMSSNNEILPLITRPISAITLLAAALYLFFAWRRNKRKQMRDPDAFVQAAEVDE
ncbi:MAG: tripartite tricarboxylate transporter permease [Candidatus Accumulibacter sp.]|jgi:putative tricarboxylic transport membrane protein|nr:tripartite tricarboxylate transporter permease [Accumulibacter sp.]